MDSSDKEENNNVATVVTFEEGHMTDNFIERQNVSVM